MRMISERFVRCATNASIAVLLSAVVWWGTGCASSNPNVSSGGYQFPGEGGAGEGAGTGASGGGVIGVGASSLLRVGDMVMVAFSDVPPPGLQEIKARVPEDGMVTLHHNVRVMAAGKTIPELERDIRAAFVPKLYRNLTAIAFSQDRYYFVGGEVKAPNRYELRGDMTVLRAIETAGGFTDFARRSRIELRRQDGRMYRLSEKQVKISPALDLPVLANDHIIVRRRIF